MISQLRQTIICGSCSRKRPGTASFTPCGLAHSLPTARTKISVDLIGLAICLDWLSRSPTMFLTSAGDIGRYGKEIDGDLWEGKRTLLLAHALGRANPTDRAWISTFLARPRERRLPREVLRLHQIIADGGSIPVGAASGSRICRGCSARIPQLGVRRCACRSRPRMAAHLHKLPDPARRVIGFRLECMGAS